jgi:hypothetical protein
VLLAFASSGRIILKNAAKTIVATTFVELDEMVLGELHLARKVKNETKFLKNL